MKKIMLVDDEILTRESIRNSVDWVSHGFIYCGDASDGEMALPLIAEWQPEILITDIKMPFMDGIELATIVRQNYPHIKIIILSGHDEFHFAQRAIRIGVEDYCLKPVGAKDLLELLNKVSKQIDDEQQKREALAYTPDKLLFDLCDGLINTSKAIEIANLINIQLLARCYVIIIVEWMQPQQEQANIELSNKQNEEKLLRLINNSFSNSMNWLSYKPSRKEIVYLIKGQDQMALEQAIDYFGSCYLEHLNHESLHAIVGIGEVKTRLQSIHESYLEAVEAKFKQRHKKQTEFELDTYFTPLSIDKPIVNRDAFLSFIKIGNNEQLKSFIDQFCEELSSLAWQSSMYGIYLLNELTLEAFQTANASFASTSNSTQLIQQFQQKVKHITTFEEAKQYLVELLCSLWEWRATSVNQYSELINKVKLYIEAQYNNNQLSLQDIAKHVGISSSHLSKIFSQETKLTITEYITQTRMYKAMVLLKTTHFKTSQIAFEVGYQDQHYFSNTFKKFTGMSPIEFRKNGQLIDHASLQQ